MRAVPVGHRGIAGAHRSWPPLPAGPAAPAAHEDAVAVEMEGSGVAHAAHISGGLPVLVVRGISDHADGGKQAADRSGSQPRAAAAAALAVIAGILPHGSPPHPR